ncbi:branched-chain amino acid ABC transporter permease [Christensenellaceae bacterium OttesenSCG-928-M15]|nr:branched-chain amino acid ABC transporter permease [Christensenellaceae bacterium OttesenSCG-928-M15]
MKTSQKWACHFCDTKGGVTIFIQQLINGLSIGSVYALMAVGYSLIYSLLNFTNFAHAIAVTVGAYTSFFLFTLFSPNLIAGFFVALLSGAAVSVLIEIVVYRHMLIKNNKRLYLMIAGLGLSMVAENLFIIFISSISQFFPNELTNMGTIELFGNHIGKIDLLILGMSIGTMVLLQAYISLTKDGLAIRSAAKSLEYSSLMGVNPDALLMKVFVIAGMLAGVAGLFMGIKYTAYPTLGSVMTNKAFVAAVLGGLGSLPGAIVGAFILGILEVMVTGYVSSALRDMIAYGVLILVLIVRPSGLMGKSSEDKA